jgi:hypothetical protein
MNRNILKLLKKIIPFFVLIFFIWLASKRTDGFSTDFITRFVNYDKTFEIKMTSDVNEIKNILSQKFHYLTRGRECFIFESNDKKYILKFFDSTRYYTKIYFPTIQLPKFLDDFRNKHYNRRKAKLRFNLSSAKIAYERLKEDAALVYVNLNKTNLFDKKLNIINKYGKEFLLDPNDVFFILQKKCDLFYFTYENSKDEAYKKYLLESFLEMVHRRTLKLVIDDDIGKKRRNWGIVDNKAVTFDIGRWYLDEKLQTPEGYKKEMIKATKIFKKYLLENEPDKLEMINQKLNEYFDTFNNNYALKCSKNHSEAK